MKTEQTLRIESILTVYHRRVAEGSQAPIHGFHLKLARRFGVSKGRITNIARSIGLTGKKPGLLVPRKGRGHK